MTNKNIFQIAKAAIKGKIKKLIIAEEVSIFGKVDWYSGDLSIHPSHTNHEDDDILDDLAQEVLSHGGEVLVLPREEIPENRTILALLENDESNDSKEKFYSANLYDQQIEWRNI